MTKKLCGCKLENINRLIYVMHTNTIPHFTQRDELK